MHTRSADEKTANAPSPASPSDSFDRGTGKPEAPKSSKFEGLKLRWPATLQWVPDNATWAKIKPTIRSTVAAWLSAVLFLIPQVEIFMGQASFLILMTSFLSPPSDPFMAVLEREITTLFFVTTAWAWSCLGIKLADMARVTRNPNATIVEVISGQYLETAPSVILAIFIFLGSCVLLYIKTRSVPSQFFACFLGCIGLDISITTAALYPYPQYKESFIPLIALLCSIAIFPSTISSHFTTRLQDVLAPLTTTFMLHETLLKKDPYSPDFSSTSRQDNCIGQQIRSCPVRLLKSDLVFSRFAPTDFIPLHKLAKRMAVRANGMSIYFTLVDSTSGESQAVPVVSRPPSLSRAPSRDNVAEVGEDAVPLTPTRKSRTHSHHHTLLHNSLLHLSLGRKKSEHAVGVFESQRYLDLEAHLSHPETEAHTKQSTALLAQCCAPLLRSCQDSLTWIQDWLGSRWMGGARKRQALEHRINELGKMRENLVAVLAELREDKRHLILEPYRPTPIQEMPPHRHLFHCYVYQYHLLQTADLMVAMLDEIRTLEKTRTKQRLWTPAHKLFLDWSWDISEFGEDEEDPDKIQGVPPALEEDDLGLARRRDPDALPPRNHLEWAMRLVYRSVSQIGGGNALFAVKAGALTVLMCLPSFLKSSATFAYRNRFVWAISMGDTAFGLTARIFSTALGGLLGMVMWYIAQYSSHRPDFLTLSQRPVCAVCFPFFFYGRLYWPGAPMRQMIFFVTAILVIGYSYQAQHIIIPGSQGIGFEVAWRRFILVTTGVVAAGVFSFLPPSTTIRIYERKTMATTSSQLGTIKITRSLTLKSNAIYEYSFKGRWPAKRYHKVMELQMQIAYSLSHMLSIISHMEPAWTRAFLRRTRLLDSDFQGDVLAVISMISTALRTGSALPQITPCPLLERFTQPQYGLNVIHKEAEEDFGLPRALTLETLQNEQYLMFCVGVATAYGIFTRLDRLMLTVKEIVGEKYHIHGAGISLPTRIATRGGIPLGSRTNTIQYRPPHEV
ncbi:hypothetical protein C8J57DRAFT_1431688 [Mycena rebaudengoi]|nr:hypothetical protein C8J57DRAFT_1431688 [Mycena rebaudengoi]